MPKRCDQRRFRTKVRKSPSVALAKEGELSYKWTCSSSRKASKNSFAKGSTETAKSLLVCKAVAVCDLSQTAVPLDSPSNGKDR